MKGINYPQKSPKHLQNIYNQVNFRGIRYEGDEVTGNLFFVRHLPVLK